eukprot:4224675-Prymnesium_polylepis.1
MGAAMFPPDLRTVSRQRPFYPLRGCQMLKSLGCVRPRLLTGVRCAFCRATTPSAHQQFNL